MLVPVWRGSTNYSSGWVVTIVAMKTLSWTDQPRTVGVFTTEFHHDIEEDITVTPAIQAQRPRHRERGPTSPQKRGTDGRFGVWIWAA